MATYRFQTLSEWPFESTPGHIRRRNLPGGANFDILRGRLSTELEAVKATQVQIRTFHVAEDLRMSDGLPKSTARRPSHPGVALIFISQNGPSKGMQLSFHCDTYRDKRTGIFSIHAILLQAEGQTPGGFLLWEINEAMKERAK